MPQPVLHDPLTLFLSLVPGQLTDAQLCLGETADIQLRHPSPGIITISCPLDALRDLGHQWQIGLHPTALEVVRCVLMPQGEEPTASDFMRSYSLRELADSLGGQWIQTVLDNKRLVTHFQPIVSTRAPHPVFAYECLIRGCEEDGQLIRPDRLFNAARATGKLNQLDHNARLTAINTSAKLGLGSGIFINFNPRHIDDSMHCLMNTMYTIIESGLDTSQVVFEVVESDDINDMGKLMRIVEHCREAGCGVALDDLGAGYNSLNILGQVKPDYVKLDMDLIRNVEHDAYKSRVASKVIELAKELQVKTVVEGIETVGSWLWAIEHGADFAQGYLIAKPHQEPPVPDILASLETNTYGVASNTSTHVQTS
ncbi:MAG: EAL domain-containing protein [Pirellulaceae bacterium]|nr:EAL domain-containing protein [Planctomycetales bacterium]